MKRVLSLIFCISVLCASAQKPKTYAAPTVIEKGRTISDANLRFLALKEDSLKQLGSKFTTDTVLDNRRKACFDFIPKFVSALKTDNSFYYPFDSLETVSKIYSPDSSFRIFTWQLVLPQGHFRYYGVIQMRSTKLKIFPLFDHSDTMTYHSQKVLPADNWYGALYYNIIQNKSDKVTYYTLFGFEAADIVTRRKVVDVLTFDESGKPQFGAPIFYFKMEEDTFRYKKFDTLTRFFIEYNYKAPTVLNYDVQLEMIVFDHVTPPVDKARGATFTYVPDGTYEGFKWGNGHWNWVEKVFTFAINEDNNPPVPVPLFGQPARQPELPK